MVGLFFGELTTLDLEMAALTGAAACVTLVVAYWMSKKSYHKWVARKLVHTVMGSIIGLTIVTYSSLSGPALAASLFLVALVCAWGLNRGSITELLAAGTRDGESRAGTFFAGFVGLASFAVVFLLFPSRPEIFVSAILAVSWGDASGEIFGRTYGGKLVGRRYRGKSVEGSIAVFFFTAVSLFTAIAIYSQDTCPFSVIPQILVVSLAVSLLEAISNGWTDNLIIPLATAFLAWALMFPSTPLPFALIALAFAFISSR